MGNFIALGRNSLSLRNSDPELQSWRGTLVCFQSRCRTIASQLGNSKRALLINAVLERQPVELTATRCSPNSTNRMIPTATARQHVPSELTEWSRVQIYDTRDRARGWAYHNPEPLTMDSCFIRIDLLLCRNSTPLIISTQNHKQ